MTSRFKKHILKHGALSGSGACFTGCLGPCGFPQLSCPFECRSTFVLGLGFRLCSSSSAFCRLRTASCVALSTRVATSASSSAPPSGRFSFRAVASTAIFQSMWTNKSNQSMKLTPKVFASRLAPVQKKLSELATTPCCGLSPSR